MNATYHPGDRPSSVNRSQAAPAQQANKSQYRTSLYVNVPQDKISRVPRVQQDMTKW